MSILATISTMSLIQPIAEFGVKLAKSDATRTLLPLAFSICILLCILVALVGICLYLMSRLEVSGYKKMLHKYTEFVIKITASTVDLSDKEILKAYRHRFGEKSVSSSLFMQLALFKKASLNPVYSELSNYQTLYEIFSFQNKPSKHGIGITSIKLRIIYCAEVLRNYLSCNRLPTKHIHRIPNYK